MRFVGLDQISVSPARRSLLPLARYRSILSNVDDGDLGEDIPLLIEDEMAYLEGVGTPLRRHAGHTFMREGERSDFVLLIKKGTVQVTAGDPARIVAFRGAGEITGEMGVIRHKRRSANVIAWDEVDVVHISDTEWRKFLVKYPRAAIAQLADAEDRIDEATTKIVDSDFAVEYRLAKALVELVDRGLADTNGTTRTIRLSQDDIASLTRSSVVSVKKVLKIFKESNIISTGRLTVTIHNMDQLTNIASGKPVPW